MNQELREKLKQVAYHLAMKYRLINGSTILFSAPPLLHERVVRMPPLLSDDVLDAPLEWLVKATYSVYPIDRVYFFSMWDYTAAMVRDQGWKPSAPFCEFVSQMFPDLQLPISTPRGVDFDTRGLLCQALVLAHHRLAGSKVHISPDEVTFKINNKVRAAVTWNSITWRDGHYLCRHKGLEPIDFRSWAMRPMYGTRNLPSKAAVLRLRLIHLMPEIAPHVDTVFRCVGLLGKEAADILTEPYDIVLTEENHVHSKEVASMLDAQRRLKAPR